MAQWVMASVTPRIGGACSLEIRFHSPYRHAIVGLLAEIGTFILVIALAVALALAAAWIA